MKGFKLALCGAIFIAANLCHAQNSAAGPKESFTAGQYQGPMIYPCGRAALVTATIACENGKYSLALVERMPDPAQDGHFTLVSGKKRGDHLEFDYKDRNFFLRADANESRITGRLKANYLAKFDLKKADGTNWTNADVREYEGKLVSAGKEIWAAAEIIPDSNSGCKLYLRHYDGKLGNVIIAGVQKQALSFKGVGESSNWTLAGDANSLTGQVSGKLNGTIELRNRFKPVERAEKASASGHKAQECAP